MSSLVDLDENAILNVFLESEAVSYKSLIITFPVNAKKSGF